MLLQAALTPACCRERGGSDIRAISSSVTGSPCMSWLWGGGLLGGGARLSLTATKVAEYGPRCSPAAFPCPVCLVRLKRCLVGKIVAAKDDVCCAPLPADDSSVPEEYLFHARPKRSGFRVRRAVPSLHNWFVQPRSKKQGFRVRK